MRCRLFSRGNSNLSTTSVRLYSGITPDILRDFHEVKASFVCINLMGMLAASRYQRHQHIFTWRIDITLSAPPDPANTPPHPVFTPEYEQKHDSKRHPETSIFCRGDNRSIGEIYAAGRIKPKGEDNNPQAIDAYDVTKHRIDSKNSYFVSGTKKMLIAHNFGQLCYGASNYTVYLFKAKDTMGPHLTPRISDEYSRLTKDEEEYSILGSVNYEDIVGFRECVTISCDNSFYCGNIYISKAFAKQHQQYVEKVIEVQKFPEERWQSRLKN